MKNKKMKIGAVMALLGSVPTAAVCVANTQLNSKANSASNGYVWNTDMHDIVKNGKDTKGGMTVELYKTGIRNMEAIKLVKGIDASIDGGYIASELRIWRGGDVYEKVGIETIGESALEGMSYVRGDLDALNIVNIDKHALSRTGITSLTVGPSLAYINEYACTDCMYLEKIEVRIANIYTPVIREGAFNNCPNLKEIRVHNLREDDVIQAWEKVAKTISKQVGHEVKVISVVH